MISPRLNLGEGAWPMSLALALGLSFGIFIDGGKALGASAKYASAASGLLLRLRLAL